jgi:hypothetical protein
MEVREHRYQVFQHNDQLEHDLFHVSYEYELYNHENSKEILIKKKNEEFAFYGSTL